MPDLVPLVARLGALAGPGAPLGQALLAGLFDAVTAGFGSARFALWRRLFGQAVGIDTGGLDRALKTRKGAGDRDYAGDVPATLFALHTGLALLARVTAAAALPGVGRRLRDPGTPVATRLAWIQSGSPFLAAGILAMPGPDPFDWLAREPPPALEPVLVGVIEAVTGAVAAAGPDAAATDLFTGLYQALVPRALRHALGEVYTPPRLAAHALDAIGWQPDSALLDPTCGSGTFLLEALGRRLAACSGAPRPGQAAALLAGLYGTDLNPLAVQMAKASLVVALAGRFDPLRPVRLPVYLADPLTLPAPAGDWAEGAGDAEAAASIGRVSHLAGNPPWVRWSQLPPAYAEAIRPVAARLALFGDDRYVGGIEPDLAAAVTLAAVGRWLRPDGRLAFYLTGSLFSTASGQGFRRFTAPEPVGRCRVLAVEDFKAIAPFEGVTNHPVLLLLEAGGATRYPVPYRVHEPGGVRTLLARPLPGTEDGPWLKGGADEHALWRRLMDASAPAVYRARKGVTTDRNGIFFVDVAPGPAPGLVAIVNRPELGRGVGIARRPAVIEDQHLFPLLRGRGLFRFRVAVEPEQRVLVPQRAMHGCPDLPRQCPRTFAWFQGFEAELRRRASYRRYQVGQPFWSVWSTGPYSFAPWKVLWREMSSHFRAAYTGPVDDPVLGPRVVIPDHKLYFVPAASEDEAAFLTGLLNAPVVARAITAYAAALSLGTSVIEILRIPPFDPACSGHGELSALARAITRAGGVESPDQTAALDRLALALLTAPE